MGLSVYLYLPLRSMDKPAVMYADLSNLSALITHITGSQFGSQSTGLTTDGPVRFYEQLQAWLAPPGGYILILAVGLAVFGLAVLWRTNRAYAVVLLAILLIHAYIDNNEDPGRRDQYLFTSSAVMILYLGVAAEAFVGRVERAWRGWRAFDVARGVAVGLIALAPLMLFVDTVPTANQSVNDQGQQFVDTIVADLPPDAVLFDLWDVRTSLEYAQQIRGQGEGPDADRERRQGSRVRGSRAAGVRAPGLRWRRGGHAGALRPDGRGRHLRALRRDQRAVPAPALPRRRAGRRPGSPVRRPLTSRATRRAGLRRACGLAAP